ncbi:helix-turn-helix domain-containing protein [Komarekiella delphini-convector]|uniref:helix-turn-helix domain-containing protein n=1 Tax=Komarekiella delphini-convector TaxID=3050158 RepID=UPI001CD8FF4F|nr:transcriptional regulator [Komarekiella delphini-convector]
MLSRYQPRIIKTEEKNENFLEIVEELLSRSYLKSQEDILLKLLTKLIEDFEEKHYQRNSSKPHLKLKHLIEAQSLEQAVLVEILGSSEIVDKVINGELKISRQQAEALGKLFHVDASLFIFRLSDRFFMLLFILTK